jgi:hypothetical protein
VRLEKSGEAGQDLTDLQQKIAAVTSSTDPVDHAIDTEARQQEPNCLDGGGRDH